MSCSGYENVRCCARGEYAYVAVCADNTGGVTKDEFIQWYFKKEAEMQVFFMKTVM